MARFDLTPRDRCHVEAARRALAAAQTVNLLDERAMAYTLGRLEVALERLIGLVDAPAPGPTDIAGPDTPAGGAA
ncbi:hypothetical protein WJ438_29045 [Streptomyces sp. GD-15H]|uniref:hypothetical protein n=1 Tax=Streptomyces sp. GD-15H TaxID=3129112 RepID=UPI00324C471E